MTRRVSPETRARRLKVEADGLRGQVASLSRQFHDKDGELNVAREAAIREQRSRDAEAVAIDGCVKALDGLTGQGRHTFMPGLDFGVTVAYDVTATPTSRVLDYLHERYVGPRPSEADLTRQLAEAHDRIRHLQQSLDDVRRTLGPS